MASPSYVQAGGQTRGIATAQTGINITSHKERFDDPKEYIEDRFGGRTGFAHAYDKSTTTSIEGETTTALDVVMAIAYATAFTVANEVDGYGVTTGDQLLDDIEVSQSRGAWTTASANLTRLSGVTVA